MLVCPPIAYRFRIVPSQVTAVSLRRVVYLQYRAFPILCVFYIPRRWLAGETSVIATESYQYGLSIIRLLRD